MNKGGISINLDNAKEVVIDGNKLFSADVELNILNKDTISIESNRIA